MYKWVNKFMVRRSFQTFCANIVHIHLLCRRPIPAVFEVGVVTHERERKRRIDFKNIQTLKSHPIETLSTFYISLSRLIIKAETLPRSRKDH